MQRQDLNDRDGSAEAEDVDSSENATGLQRTELHRLWMSLVGLPGTRRRRMIQRSARILVASVVIAFLALTVGRSWQDLASNPIRARLASIDGSLVLLSLLVYMLGMLPPAMAWRNILQAFGQAVPRRQVFYAYFLGHLGKYVLGKAMVFVLRVGQLRPYGVEVKPAILSIFVETLTGIGTGAILGSVLICAQRPPLWVWLVAIGCIGLAAIPLLPHPFRAILAVISKSKIGRMPPMVTHAITARLMTVTCLWMLLGWLMAGSAGWLLLLGVIQTTELWSAVAWITCVGAVSLGAVAGFFSMLPGGAIVRELAITWLLASIIPSADALGFAILFRFITIAAELLMIAISGAFAYSERKTKRPL